MGKNYEQLFERILMRIKEERRLIAVKRMLVASFVVMAGSVAAFIPIFNAARTGLYESGFINSLSLIFSDFGIVMSYWQNFALSLLETFPVLEVAGVLFVGAIFFLSVNFIVKSIQYILAPSKLIINPAN